jgi:hypothetical protein
MTDYCRNEAGFSMGGAIREKATIEAILDFIKETPVNYERRLKRIVARNKKFKDDEWSETTRARLLFDFNNLVPYPEKFAVRDEDFLNIPTEDFVAKYGNARNGMDSGGYEWRVKNWGCPFNPDDVVWVPVHCTLYFDTAGVPAFPVMSALHKRFPEIFIQYEYYNGSCGLTGGCDYIPKVDWDPSDIVHEQAFTIEQQLKKGLHVVPSEWEAGQAYNRWFDDYKGFKGW